MLPYIAYMDPMGTMKGVSALSFLQHVLHREIPSSMFGCLSGGWSLVVGQLQLQTWPWGVQVLWQTLVFEAFFYFAAALLPTRGKTKLMRRYFLPQGPEAVFVRLWCF